MRRVGYWALVSLICAFGLFCAYVGVIIMVFSSHFGVDIDSTEAQRQAAESRAWVFTLVGFIIVCCSIVMMSCSGRIARSTIRFLGGRAAA
jgi:hypothetical protein